MKRNNFLRKIEMNLRKIVFPSSKQRERDILRKICIGKGADIGCGSNKVSENAIGIDLTAKGEKGKAGNQKNMISKADICTSGDDLPFKNNELNYIVAKHNLEHYNNPEKTLLEWKRVVKKGGKIGVIVPDNDFVDSKKLDLTHYFDFNLQSL